GLPAADIDAITRRAGISRRTFSRHFPSREAAILDGTRADFEGINAQLRARPADEAPTTAYRNAVRDWLAAEFGGLRRSKLEPYHSLYRQIVSEPALFGAFATVRMNGERQCTRIMAERLGVQSRQDPTPSVASTACSGVLAAALRAWARGTDPYAIHNLVEQYFNTLPVLLSPTSASSSQPARRRTAR
ncbi:TetR/AcrR family transcriptional regulator, partial [Nocardia salmonicida]